jgi:hypothetical protein
MVVEPVIVDIIDKARIERYLFRGPYVVKMGWMVKTSQIVVVLRSRHREGMVNIWCCVWRKVWRRRMGTSSNSRRAPLLYYRVGRGRAIRSKRESCQASSQSVYFESKDDALRWSCFEACSPPLWTPSFTPQPVPREVIRRAIDEGLRVLNL